jgi:transposase InsO family protein
MPFEWIHLHPDNDSSFINWHLLHYCKTEGIEFSRSRPYKKNDNSFVEQKNSTHVRAVIGHLRYDTEKELDLINSLYRNELRLYKNFFQPVMKLKEKIRDRGKVHRRYDWSEPLKLDKMT